MLSASSHHETVQHVYPETRQESRRQTPRSRHRGGTAPTGTTEERRWTPMPSPPPCWRSASPVKACSKRRDRPSLAPAPRSSTARLCGLAKWRRGRDSNPRSRNAGQRFSRPSLSSAQPPLRLAAPAPNCTGPAGTMSTPEATGAAHYRPSPSSFFGGGSLIRTVRLLVMRRIERRHSP